jgi:hypothetical protein
MTSPEKPNGSEVLPPKPKGPEAVQQNLAKTAENVEKNAKQHEIQLQQEVENWKNRKIDIATVPATTILDISSFRDKDGKEEGLRALQQAYFKDANGKEVDEAQEGMEMKVDFHGNMQAERFVGAGNLLPMNVQALKIKDREGKERIGIRKATPRVGYYDENGYIPIFSGYTIQPLSKNDFEQYRSEQIGKFNTQPSISDDPYSARLDDWGKQLGSYQYVDEKSDQWKGRLAEEKESHNRYRELVAQRERREIRDTFLTQMWAKAREGNNSVDAVVDGYIENIMTEKTQNPTRVDEAEWSRIISEAGDIKKAFQAVPQVEGKAMEWIKEGVMTPDLFQGKSLDQMKEALQNINDGNIDADSMKLLQSGEGRDFLPYIPDLIMANAQSGVPIKVMVQMMIREGSHGDPTRGTGGLSSALGLGQMIGSTWATYKPEGANADTDRTNPHMQILAMAKYLKHLHDVKGSWADAMVYYNTGEGGVGNLDAYVRCNPAIASLMTEHSEEGYLAAARKYYTNNNLGIDFDASENVASKQTPASSEGGVESVA